MQAGIEGIQDGTPHSCTSVQASLRVAVGTVLALLVAIPLGIAMGVSPVVSSFLTPLFRFFSVLAGIAWIPIATLWFGYGFGAITFVIFNAVFFIVTYNTLLGVSTDSLHGAQCRRIARRGAMGDADRGAAAGRASQHRHGHVRTGAWLCLARADRRRDDRHQRRPRLHAVRRARLLSRPK